jgi:hypothetical protein
MRIGADTTAGRITESVRAELVEALSSSWGWEKEGTPFDRLRANGVSMQFAGF